MNSQIAARPALDTGALMGSMWKTFKANVRSILPLGLVMLMPTSVAGAFVQTMSPEDPMIGVAYLVQFGSMAVAYPLVFVIATLMAERGHENPRALGDLVQSALGRLGGPVKTFLVQWGLFCLLGFALVLVGLAPLIVGLGMESMPLMIGGGILCAVACVATLVVAIQLNIRWIVSLPMACMGHASGMDALRSSTLMTTGNRMRIFIVMLIVGAIMTVTSIIFTLVPAFSIGISMAMSPGQSVPAGAVMALAAGTLIANTVGWFSYGLFGAHTYLALQRAEVGAHPA